MPPAIDRLLEQTLTADLSQRFASATALKDTLDRFFHEAGYIFSHATLAAYLKGMFPEMAELPKDPNTEADEEQENARSSAVSDPYRSSRSSGHRGDAHVRAREQSPEPDTGIHRRRHREAAHESGYQPE